MQRLQQSKEISLCALPLRLQFDRRSRGGECFQLLSLPSLSFLRRWALKLLFCSRLFSFNRRDDPSLKCMLLSSQPRRSLFCSYIPDLHMRPSEKEILQTLLTEISAHGRAALQKRPFLSSSKVVWAWMASGSGTGQNLAQRRTTDRKLKLRSLMIIPFYTQFVDFYVKFLRPHRYVYCSVKLR